MEEHFNKQNNFYTSAKAENKTESILLKSITLAGLDVLIIGENIQTANRTIIDFLGIDCFGKPVAFLKNMDKDIDNAFENNLNITLFLDKLTLQSIELYCQKSYNHSFQVVFGEKFNTSIANINNSGNYIILVTDIIDKETAGILEDMITKYRIPINALVFENIKNEQEDYIKQTWFVDPKTDYIQDTAEPNQPASWNESYSLGIPIIDRQHKMFFAIYDELAEQQSTNITDQQKLSIIEKINNYVSGHFHTEEILLKRCGFSETDQHIQEHKMFFNKTNEFKLSFDYNNALLANQMLAFIRKWFLSHISNSDAKYKIKITEYINSLE